MSAEIQKYISEISGSLNLISRRIEFETLQDRIFRKTSECENPEIWKDQTLAKGLMRERQALLEQFETFSKLKNEFDDIKTLFEIGSDEKDELLLVELENSFSKLKNEVTQVEILSLLDGEADSNDAFLEINSGAGGTESCDWAQMLARMYYRWAEKKKYKIELISESQGDEAGIKSCCYKIVGNNAYGWLRAESGVHRLVRISPFDSSSRRHTSFSSVWVYPVVDDNFDIEINPSDLRIDTFRSSGPGGQHANKTDSAVRITHLP
ncbi:MAG: peptide chain release factor 2, partial [Rhodobacteraceae bacterium]|nr:peptide chain release factor 2 [Paracoccaceae bacterium]